LDLRDTKQGKKATVNPVLCKGDGLCNTKCPTGAIQLKHYTDEELVSEIDALAAPEEETLPHMDAAVGDA
jgi:heterodisulfide reductase subunit A